MTDDVMTITAETLAPLHAHRPPAAPGRAAPRHRHGRRPRAAGDPSRDRDGDPGDLHRPVLLPRQHRHARPGHRDASPASTTPTFSLPTAVLLGVTGVTRAYAFVIDIQNGYFDRLLMTPIRRLAILLGQMCADLTVASGAGGADHHRRVHRRRPLRGRSARRRSCSSLIAALWCLAYAGFAYAIALKTGNPAAVQSSFLLFFPFLFLTSSYVPREPAVRLARHRGDVQPGDVHPRGAALAGASRAGSGPRSARRCSPSPSSARSACLAVLRRLPRPDHQGRLSRPISARRARRRSAFARRGRPGPLVERPDRLDLDLDVAVLAPLRRRGRRRRTRR